MALSILEQTSTPFLLMTGPEHRIVFANAGYVELLRRNSAEALLGKTIREALPEIAWQGFFERLDHVFATGNTYVGQQAPALLIDEATGDAREYYFDFTYQAIRDGDGAITAVLAQAVDVTHHVTGRAAAEARQTALAIEWEHLHNIYKHAPVGFALYEPKEFRLVLMNHKFGEMLNMTEEQLLGRSVLEFAGNIEGVRARFQRVADGGRIENAVIEGELESQPGRYRSWIINYTPLFNSDGTVHAISTVSVDHTAQRQAERALLQNEKLAAVGRLASSIAHEINNPLESVTNLLYLVQMNTTDPEQARYLDLAEQELRRVSAIANQTLRFHRQQSAPTTIDPRTLFTSLCTVYEGRLRNSGIHVVQSVIGDVEVHSMESDLRQVMSNLVGNAIDAMPTGGRLTLRARASRNWATMQPGVVLTVADTGSGIPLNIQKEVFEAFFTTKGIGGTGLGLWISTDIVKRLGGCLRLRSSTQARRRGTAFTIFLPAH